MATPHRRMSFLIAFIDSLIIILIDQPHRLRRAYTSPFQLNDHTSQTNVSSPHLQSPYQRNDHTPQAEPTQHTYQAHINGMATHLRRSLTSHSQSSYKRNGHTSQTKVYLQTYCTKNTVFTNLLNVVEERSNVITLSRSS